MEGWVGGQREAGCMDGWRDREERKRQRERGKGKVRQGEGRGGEGRGEREGKGDAVNESLTDFPPNPEPSTLNPKQAFYFQQGTSLSQTFPSLTTSLIADLRFSTNIKSAAIENMTPSPRISAPDLTASASLRGFMLCAVCPISCTCIETSILCHH